jgi:parallel beta-helix repeat protein
MFSFVRCNVSVKASSEVIYVPEDFTKIQDAINHASPGATILIANGTYHEFLTINKPLTLLGQGSDVTIIDGNGAGYTISITADNVTIEDLTVTNTGTGPYISGVHADQCNGVIINDTEIAKTYNGLTVSFVTNSVFSENIIVNNTNGVLVLYSNDNVFSNNIVQSNSEGISIYYSSSNVFSGNTFSNNAQGVFVSWPSDRNYFYDNNFEDQDPVQVTEESPNFWNYNGEGNYWVVYNFTGRDANADGIGNEPYYIDSNNRDDYPLMGTFSEFTVVVEQEELYVTVVSNSTISDFGFEIGNETGNKILSFKATGESDTTGFCRLMIPTSLMEYPFTVLDNEGELTSSVLNASEVTNTYLYFTYVQNDQNVAVISSIALQQYEQLLANYTSLQTDLDNLNATYQASLNSLSMLLQNLSQLQTSYLALSSSLQKNILDQSDNVQNIRNLTYIFAASTGAFLITTVYLSTRAKTTKKPKAYTGEEKE